MGVTVVPQDNEMSAAVRDAAGDAVCDGPAASGHIDDSNALSDSSGGRSSSPSSASLDNPLKLRESAMLGGAVNKGQKICCYQMCPSPMHSKKWRIVTEGTSAGGRDWDALVGKTLCDSCYSTFRKHGTFVRSIRTNDGWSRSVQAGTIGVKRPALASGPLHEAKSKPSPKPTMSRSQPSPKRPRTQSAAPKLPAVASAATSGTSNGALPKRKAAMKAAGSWRVAGGDKGGAVDRQVEAELLDAVAILRSMQRSSYAGGVAESVAASGREQSRSPAPLQTGARRASQDHLSASPDATTADDGAAAAAHVKPAAAGDAGCLRDGSPAPPCLVPLVCAACVACVWSWPSCRLSVSVSVSASVHARMLAHVLNHAHRPAIKVASGDAGCAPASPSGTAMAAE